ncbi:MAG: hypothetical protein IPN96_19590 [Anaerolineales bacterium]|nr:hypothetical protein [Anaerolineales bacterium]
MPPLFLWDDLTGFEITVPAALLITRVDEEEYLMRFNWLKPLMKIFKAP